MPFVEELSAQ